MFPEYYRDGWVTLHFGVGPVWLLPPFWLHWLRCKLSPKYGAFYRAMSELE